MASSTLNESEILKSLVRKGAVADLFRDMYPQAGSSPLKQSAGKAKQVEDQEVQRAQMRQIAKIWTALSKLVRSQCNKGRVIDSLYFGSFAKTAVMSSDDSSAQKKTYSYCPGPRAIFSLLENAENIRNVNQELIDKKLVSASLQAIADVCGCGADVVQAVLQLFRDEVVDLVQQRKKEVSLNFLIGHLILSPVGSGGQVQFKSLTITDAIANQQTMSGVSSVRLTENSLRGLNNNSRNSSQPRLDDKSIAERSINYMQQRQSTASVGRRSQRVQQAAGAVGIAAAADKIFGTPSQADKAKAEGGEDHPYFHKRMVRSRSRRAPGSHVAGLLTTNAQDQGEGDGAKAHSHLDDFLRSQIQNTKAGPKSQGKRSAVSAASSRRNNALIEQAANLAQYKKHQRGQKSTADALSDCRSTASDTVSQKIITKANTTVMRISGYQADPLAATMQTRSIGLAKLNVNKNMKSQDRDLFTQSLKVKGNRLHDSGLKLDMVQKDGDEVSQQSQQASARILNQLSDVEMALYRKKISQDYHTTVPKFMRSQGPFAVYDHGVHKGAHSFDTIGKVNEQALQRFHDQINGVQKTRETEKHQFYSTLDYMDRMEYFKQQDRKNQNRANREFIQNQIAEKQQRKSSEHEYEQLYYKPHFGPEETLDQVQVNLEAQQAKKEFLRQNLTNQINANRQLSEASRQDERRADQKFIRATTNAQNLENAALIRKDQIMKQNLRETWRAQMDIKSNHNKCDNFFK